MSKSLYFFLAVVLFLVLWSLNKGFDISDEGLYSMMTLPQQENDLGLFNYDLFFQVIYLISKKSFSLVELRILRLLGYFLGAFALLRFLKSQRVSPFSDIESFSILLIFLTGGYAFLPASLSYNSLLVVFSSIWLWILFSTGFKGLGKGLGLGIILAFIFYVKFPVAVLLFLLTGLFLWLQNQANWRNWILIPVPFCLFEGIFWFITDENASIRLWRNLNVYQLRPGYSLDLVLKSPLVGVFWILGAIGIGWVLAKTYKSRTGIYYPILGLVCISFVSLIFWTHITQEWNHVLLLAWAGMSAFELGKRKTQLSLDPVFWLLVLLPFILHFGSNVYWLRIGIHYLVFWILAAWYAGFLHSKIITSSAAVLVLLIFIGLVAQPFQQVPLWRQNQTWNIPSNSRLQLDSELVQILEKLQPKLVEQDEILCLYRNPGFAYLLGKRIPRHPVYWEVDPTKSSFPIEFEGPVLWYSRDDFEVPETLKNWEIEEIGMYQDYPVRLLWKR